MLWMLILRQSSVEPSKRQSVFIYIDETPSFLGIPNSNLDEALSQSRQFNVGWNIGFQHLAQMSPQLKAGIESNVSDKQSLRTSIPNKSVVPERRPFS